MHPILETLSDRFPCLRFDEDPISAIKEDVDGTELIEAIIEKVSQVVNGEAGKVYTGSSEAEYVGDLAMLNYLANQLITPTFTHDLCSNIISSVKILAMHNIWDPAWDFSNYDVTQRWVVDDAFKANFRKYLGSNVWRHRRYLRMMEAAFASASRLEYVQPVVCDLNQLAEFLEDPFIVLFLETASLQAKSRVKEVRIHEEKTTCYEPPEAISPEIGIAETTGLPEGVAKPTPSGFQYNLPELKSFTYFIDNVGSELKSPEIGIASGSQYNLPELKSFTDFLEEDNGVPEAISPILGYKNRQSSTDDMTDVEASYKFAESLALFCLEEMTPAETPTDTEEKKEISFNSVGKEITLSFTHLGSMDVSPC